MKPITNKTLLVNLLAATTMAVLPACQTPTRGVAPVYGITNPAPSNTAPLHFCSIIGLRPGKEAEYRQLRANVWPEIRTALRQANIRNYNIYIGEISGKKYLVSHFEYVGKNLRKDFALLAKNPVIRSKWAPLLDSYQVVIKGTPHGEKWLQLEQIMHID